MNGRDPMKGRHAVGGRTGNPGKWRKGQSEPASNKIKTGVPGGAPIRSQQSKPPVLTDAAHTSSDTQKQVRMTPQPFANPAGTVNVPAPNGPRGAMPGQEPKNIYAGKSGSSVGQSNPPGSPVGYSTLPNQSAQIGGRMGFPPPKRKAGMNGAGYPSKRNASFYGE